MRRRVQGLCAFACVVGGCAVIYWPAAVVAAGVLLLVDLIT